MIAKKSVDAISRENEGSALITKDQLQGSRQSRKQPGDPLARRIVGPETDEDIRLDTIELIAAIPPESGTVRHKQRGAAVGEGHILAGHRPATSGACEGAPMTRAFGACAMDHPLA
ncbi:MAG: hypothetical protein HC788_01185 [Sphingopyxis sp.]|nr:hypothetical protein [Sphingopyxis sp.]